MLVLEIRKGIVVLCGLAEQGGLHLVLSHPPIIHIASDLSRCFRNVPYFQQKLLRARFTHSLIEGGKRSRLSYCVQNDTFYYASCCMVSGTIASLSTQPKPVQCCSLPVVFSSSSPDKAITPDLKSFSS